MGVTAGIFLASILLKEMRYLVSSLRNADCVFRLGGAKHGLRYGGYLVSGASLKMNENMTMTPVT
jgi:hypothetical protein